MAAEGSFSASRPFDRIVVAMSKDTSSGVGRTILIAGLLTLLISLVRLIGELQGWNPKFFPSGPGGQGGYVGIVWLIPVVGFLVGRKLKQRGKGPGSSVFVLVAVLLGLGAIGGLGYQLVQFEEAAKAKQFFLYVIYGAAGGALLVLLAWPRAFLALLGYGIFARGPVIGIQYMMIHWTGERKDTHYEQLYDKLKVEPAAERAHWLMLAQAGIWIPLTIILGALFALLGTFTARARKDE